MHTQPGVSNDLPFEQPSVARMYDYLLGGYHNVASDRAAADAAVAIYPDFPLVLHANRAFLRRSVAFLVAQGIEQFLDLGSGIPTVGNVHEVAQELNPAARVVYVDVDPIAVTQSTALLHDNPATAVIQADVRQPAPLLAQPELRRVLDLDRPLAVLLVAFLHFLPDDVEAERVVEAVRAALSPGSYLVLSHATADGAPGDVLEQLDALYARTAGGVYRRTHAQIAAFFTGLEMVEPGLVYTPLWRPEDPDDVLLDQPERSIAFAGVGRRL